MEQVFGSFYDDDPQGGTPTPLPDNTPLLREHGIVAEHSEEAERKAQEFRLRLASGERLLLVGLNIGHNAGLALIEASATEGIVVHANFEEERFTAIKHFAGYPAHSVRALLELLRRLGRSASELFCVLYAWDSVAEEQCGLRLSLFRDKIIRNRFFSHVSSAATPQLDKVKVVGARRKNLYGHSLTLIEVMRRLNADLGCQSPLLCIQALHHDNHAYYAYGVSPFFQAGAPGKITMISCIDGAGDASATSLYKASGDRVELIKRCARENSLGVFYMLCASFLGGWAPLSSEGRYMGAAAWGNGDRLTNPFYKRLRQFFYFGPDGEVFVNTAMTRDDCRGLQEVVGPFLAVEDLWNPDAVLNVDNVQHARITQERVDKAAAVQMVFEDALFHIIEHLIQQTGSDRLVLCGGTALNCVANMRLLQHFDQQYYQRYLGQSTQLHIWVPPIPSDQGVVVGAAFQFAMRNGAEPRRMTTAFLCGPAATAAEIGRALAARDDLLFDRLGSIHDVQTRGEVADWMAYLVAEDAVIGIFQGEAETGPRALGHRSLLSNPCNPNTLALLNDRVKLRERVRPLAPMVTLEEAGRWFELSPGASDGDYDAYSYMVLTAPATPEGRKKVPAVVHHDGTSRIQIVRPENNALMYDYLKALGRYIGVEVSVNTSLNVGTPIVQTPAQAVEIFKRARGLDGIFLVADEGDVYMVWAKSGVQKYDSNLPRIARSYLRDRPVKKLAECFTNALAQREQRAAEQGGEERERQPVRLWSLADHPALMAIKAGKGTPWLGVYGLTGDATDDLPLFQVLARQCPVYALRTETDLAPGTGITQIASRHAEALARALKDQPCCLAGYSYGGVLAFEIVRCLREKGHRGEFSLLLVDTPFAGVSSTDSLAGSSGETERLALVATTLLRNYLGSQSLQREPLATRILGEVLPGQRVSALARELNRRGIPLPAGVIERKLTRKEKLCQQLAVALHQFRPVPLPGARVRLSYVHSYQLDEPGSQHTPGHAYQWLRLVPGSRFFRIPTDDREHALFSLLAQARLAELLDIEMRMADAPVEG